MRRFILICLGVCLYITALPVTAAPFQDISEETLRDKIRGGLLGQILGNLNGLPHEMKYIDEPGTVTEYLPALPEGARTDDDTDFEWVYILEMQQAGKVILPSEQIADLWRNRINRRIWCSNQYARQLMDLGVEPPLTGTFALNPWADFNISGQFICESFGLLAPGMPNTAAEIGLNYTRVTIDFEPAQTTQLFTAMIATAFFTDDLETILEAGLAAIDKKSELNTLIADVRRWHKEHPADWRTTRQKVKEKYSKHGGAMRDRNGYELNTASTIAALLYGDGDFVQTLIHAFNFGWDCDNSAATAGTIIGVTHGYRWMLSQGWQIVDRYKNTTRENMPMDETITSFADRLIELAERVILENGGRRLEIEGRPSYLIATQVPENQVPLPNLSSQIQAMKSSMGGQIETWLLAGPTPQDHARGTYLAICLDLADSLRSGHPEEWDRGLAALEDYWNVVQVLYYQAPFPAGDTLRAKATAAGLDRPAEKKPLWK
jgi:ADP-ribosylglycohydrolase